MLTVGDRVQLVKTSFDHNQGKTGTIVSFDDNGDVLVSFDQPIYSNYEGESPILSSEGFVEPERLIRLP